MKNMTLYKFFIMSFVLILRLQKKEKPFLVNSVGMYKILQPHPPWGRKKSKDIEEGEGKERGKGKGKEKGKEKGKGKKKRKG